MPLQLLEPFGEGNPQPLIGVLKMKLAEITPLSGESYLRFTFMQNDYIIHCVKFNITVEQFEYCIGDLLDLAVTLEAREYHGAPRTSIHLRAYKPAEMDLQAVFDGFTVWEQAHNGAPLSKGQKAPPFQPGRTLPYYIAICAVFRGFPAASKHCSHVCRRTFPLNGC